VANFIHEWRNLQKFISLSLPYQFFYCSGGLQGQVQFAHCNSLWVGGSAPEQFLYYMQQQQQHIT
jgi:hypothetical protein